VVHEPHVPPEPELLPLELLVLLPLSSSLPLLLPDELVLLPEELVLLPLLVLLPELLEVLLPSLAAPPSPKSNPLVASP
jgi:hypothetical protein